MSSKQLVKKVFKAIPEQGPHYTRSPAPESKHFLHINPIKKAKTKTEKTINRKARQIYRKATGHTEALQSYKQARSRHYWDEMYGGKEGRQIDRDDALEHKKNIQKRNKSDAIFVSSVGASVGALGYSAKKVNDRRKENKTVKGRIKKAIGR